MTKQELRTDIKSKQKEFFNISPALPENYIHKSYNLCKKICDTPQFQNADFIFAFMPMKDEVNIGGIITEAFILNKKVAVPKITDKNGLMQFHWINSESVMIPGAFGIYEPSENPVSMSSVQSNALLLVPGMAFTLKGKRLGRGKGFYDRFLSEYKNKFTTLGICFDFQIYPEDDFPFESNDIPVDTVFFC